MSHFNMSYDEVLNSPMKRLTMLAKAIPKVTQTKKDKKLSLLEFARKNNLLKKDK